MVRGGLYKVEFTPVSSASLAACRSGPRQATSLISTCYQVCLNFTGIGRNSYLSQSTVRALSVAPLTPEYVTSRKTLVAIQQTVGTPCACPYCPGLPAVAEYEPHSVPITLVTFRTFSGEASELPEEVFYIRCTLRQLISRAFFQEWVSLVFPRSGTSHVSGAESRLPYGRLRCITISFEIRNSEWQQTACCPW